MCVVNDEEKKAGNALGVVVPAFRARALVALLGLAMSGMAATGASAESRTISMYHIHTKERITITYWKDGHFIPSALRKLNWFLRDWRKRRAVHMDPRTIDLIWKLHADLRSKKPVYIICGHRSAATNAMLRRIGRHVARRSRHITGQAIDFRFPDVPNWKVRNLALAYGLGGVGYYGEGRNGFIHADSGSVRHWPRMPQYKVASIIRKYRRMIGRGWKRGNSYIMVANASRGSNKRMNFNKRAQAARKAPAVKAGEVLLASASPKGIRHAARVAAAKAAAAKVAKGGKAARKPIPLPGVKPVLLAAKAAPAGNANAPATPAVPTPRARPYQVLVLAASRMEITPASAPATETNFANPRSARDPIGVVIASLPPQQTANPVALEAEARAEAAPVAARHWPRVMRAGKGDLAVALANGEARGVPTIANATLRGSMPATGVARNGKGNMLSAPLGMTPQQLARRDGAPLLRNDTQQAGMFWPGMRVRAVPDRMHRPQRVNRNGKGDLLTAARLPESIRKAALEEGALKAAALKPISFR